LEAASDQAAEGRRICAELIAGLREIPGVAGAHIMAPAQGPDAIAAVLAGD
jgi:methylenetetrahydrofolate reductase (NADPH)